MSERPWRSRKSGRNHRISPPSQSPLSRQRLRSTPLHEAATWRRSRPASPTSASPARRATTAIATSTRSDYSVKQPVWDLPIRLFHWLLTGLIAFSWWSVKNHHTELHIWSGIAILTLLLFRLLWGWSEAPPRVFRVSSAARAQCSPICATRQAGAWPATLLSGLERGRAAGGDRGPGRARPGLNRRGRSQRGTLGHLVSLDTSESARDLHEYWFYVVLALIVLHVGAILIPLRARAKAHFSNDRRPCRLGSRRRADEGGSVVGCGDLSRRGAGSRALGGCRGAAVRHLIASRRRTTSPPC